MERKKFIPDKNWAETHFETIRDELGLDTPYTFQELRSLLREHRRSWQVPKHYHYELIVDELCGKKLLHKARVGPTTLYISGEPSPYQVANALHHNAYFCHFTAAYILGLTLNIPKTIYVNREQSDKGVRSTSVTLEQTAVDAAFKKERRFTSRQFQYQKNLIVFLNGKHTGNAGVVEVDFEGSSLRVTGTERTLLDMVVHPEYSGGVYQVMEAFERAKDKLSVPKLSALLRHLDYIYPYHQSVGFYLEKAGFADSILKRFERPGFTIDFYLARGMGSPVYDSRWHLFVPMGMEIIR